jgi:hypothetical protein
MKSTDNVVSKITLLAGLALACVALSGCASQGAAVLNDLQGCHRHYNGAVTSGLAGLTAPQFTGSVDIECAAGITTGVLIPNAPADPAKPAVVADPAPAKP